MTAIKMSPSDLAKAYAETIYGQPNGWGQYCHPTLGASHYIMLRLTKAVGERDAQRMINNAMVEYHKHARRI